MTVGEDGWPLRSEVRSAWQQVIDGEHTRESVHAWAVPWVEGEAGVSPSRDVMVETGLQYLHGLTMTASPESPNLISHGGLGNYVVTDGEVVTRLEHWLLVCRDYDADPSGFLQRVRDRRPR